MKVALIGTAYGPTHLTLPFLGLESIQSNKLSLSSLSKTIVPTALMGSGTRLFMGDTHTPPLSGSLEECPF